MFNLMFYGGLILAFASLILSVVLFIKNDVAKLIADVTGWSAKFAVMKMNKEKAVPASEQKSAEQEQKSKEKTQKEKPSKEKINKEKSAPKKSKFRLAKEPMADIFQMEEEMMVLAGDQATKRKPLIRKEQKIVSSELSEVLRSTSSIEDGKDTGETKREVADIEGTAKRTTSRSERRKRRLEAINNPVTAVLTDQPTDVLEDEETAVLQDGDLPTDLLEDEETDLLPEGDLPTDLLEDEETDLLPDGDLPTDFLEDEETDILPEDEDDEATSVLTEEEDDEAASVLSEEEVPTEVLWAAGDEPTDVLEDESTILLYDDEELEGILGSESTVLLQPEVKPTLVLMSDTDEEQPLPDIFDVQETATIVHTDEKIGESQILTDD